MTREERVLARLEGLVADHNENNAIVLFPRLMYNAEIYIKYPKEKQHIWIYKYLIVHDTVYKWKPPRNGFFPIYGKFAKLVALSVVFK